MALEANEAERIYVEILLGIPRSESLVRMRPEVERFWDGLVVQIEQMRADGKGFMIPNEFPDVLPTKETEVRFNPQQPRAPDGKWTSGGGGAMADDTGGDTPSGGGSSDDDDYYGGDAITATGAISKVYVDEEVEAMAMDGDSMYADVVDDALGDVQGDYLESLDDNTKQALEEYTGQGYKITNKALRGAPPPPIENQQTYDSALERASLINRAIKDAPPLEQGLIAYRGVDVRALGLDDPAKAESLVGSVFTDKGIISTSLSQDVGIEFTKIGNAPGAAVVLEVRVPYNAKALYVNPVSASGGEYELLLPSNTQFTAVDFRNMGSTAFPKYTLTVDAKTP